MARRRVLIAELDQLRALTLRQTAEIGELTARLETYEPPPAPPTAPPPAPKPEPVLAFDVATVDPVEDEDDDESDRRSRAIEAGSSGYDDLTTPIHDYDRDWWTK